MEAGDFGRLKLVVNSVRALERSLPYTVECECGEPITTKTMSSADCPSCGIRHEFRSIRD
jgi:hypothetical protein